FQELSTYAAVVNRLSSMWEATESAGAPSEDGAAAPSEKDTEPPPRIERAVDNERAAYENLTLWTPRDKRLLVRDLTLEVPRGRRLLISGPSGGGKSVLCLAMAGLWGAGHGKIIAPDKEHVMFLPQRLY